MQSRANPPHGRQGEEGHFDRKVESRLMLLFTQHNNNVVSIVRQAFLGEIPIYGVLRYENRIRKSLLCQESVVRSALVVDSRLAAILAS